ncbi:MAG TPA: xanthine dehydrogenase family protein subunit M [Methylomirabilota bacterium]|nr:xanthine dehydrogenase family protein subunit M [Methylomirabilota bacterium]
MKPVPFAYHRPASLDEALALLERYGADGRVLAGGQSLVPALNMRLAAPAALIDINRLPGLDAISVEREGLVIGALARHEAVEASSLVARHAPLISQAMPHVGHRAIRTRGTVGGSVALADPAAELPACLVALDAVIRVAGRGTRREIPALSFFRGIYTTDLAQGEIVTAVVVPPIRLPWRSRFDELTRRHGDYALVGLAAHCRVEGGVIKEARLAFCGVGATPVRALHAELALGGCRPSAEVLADAGRALDADLDPPGDVHGSPALRRHLARVLLARGVAALAGATKP